MDPQLGDNLAITLINGSHFLEDAFAGGRGGGNFEAIGLMILEILTKKVEKSEKNFDENNFNHHTFR